MEEVKDEARTSISVFYQFFTIVFLLVFIKRKQIINKSKYLLQEKNCKINSKQFEKP